jgi:hypothetical protein
MGSGVYTVVPEAKHDTMNGCMGHGDVAPRITVLGTGRR